MSKREARKQPTSVFKGSKGLKVVKKRARRACRKRMQGRMRKLGDPKHQQSCHSAEQPKNDNASSFKAMKRPEWEALVKFVVYLEEMLEKYMDKAVMDGIREAAKATNFCTFPCLSLYPVTQIPDTEVHSNRGLKQMVVARLEPSVKISGRQWYDSAFLPQHPAIDTSL